MVITEQELADVESYLDSNATNTAQDPDDRLSSDNFFFSPQLHLLLPCGFDEVRYEYGTPRLTLPHLPVLPREGKVRELASGAWYRVLFGSEPVYDSSGNITRYEPTNAVLFPEPLDAFAKGLSRGVDLRRFIPLPEVLAACRRPMSHTAAVILPWLADRTPGKGRVELVDTTKALLVAIQQERLELSGVSWRQLEEVVGELLRARGLKVHVTNRTGDGGRDIIARGELIPGEPTVFAVEVKHKHVVGVADVRQTLWANRRYPVIMVATSGRFTAGVVKERTDPDNHYRLMLKDGVALRQWIDAYGRGA